LDSGRSPRRINPFGETEDETFPEAEDSLLQQMFIVRFLGSMAVKTDNTTEVIYEAMRQVLAARAIHNIFRTTESHLLVTSQTLRLIDPQTQVTRANVSTCMHTDFSSYSLIQSRHFTDFAKFNACLLIVHFSHDVFHGE